MKYSTIISVGAAVSLAACHDATAPEPPATTSHRDASVSVAGVDSSDAWVSVALDDAATRLLANLQDSPARGDLKRALAALATDLARGERRSAVHASHAEAHEALARLRTASDPASAPDLDAIALAIVGVESRLVRREQQ